MSRPESEVSFYKEQALSVFEPSPEVVKAVDGIVNQMEAEARAAGKEPNGKYRYIERLSRGIDRNPRTGVKYALFTDPDRQEVNSDTEAILVPGPFATDLKTMVLIGEMTRRIAKFADCRDRFGRVLPVIMFSAPVADAGVRLNSSQVRQVKMGNFRPIAEKYLETTEEFIPGLEKVHIMGVSFGGGMVPVLANLAVESGKQVGGLIMGVPGNMKQGRGIIDLTQCFASEGAAMSPYLNNHRQGVFRKTEVAGVGAMIRQASNNLALLQGLAAGSFFEDLSVFNKRCPNVPSYMFFTDGDTVARTEYATDKLGAFTNLNAATLPTRERHGVVYNQHILGQAILTALSK
ncbi:MAG TPA: hypothetical protein VLA77_04330 [Candidatus Saccharimonadales bacterium]|nr:hypothetical protein [Candidatus Saccharimonadales bacterium]